MINLPFPPTTNSLTGVHNGRKIKSNKYRKWEEDAGWALCGQAYDYVPAGQLYHLEVTLVRPDKRPRDVNNYDKALVDLLVKHGITPDDSLAQSILVQWADAKPGPTVKVRAG